MIVKNEKAVVWLIKDNKLVKGHRVVSSLNYNGTEIAVLSSERDDSIYQELLIKDKDNEYYKMNFADVRFEEFINAILDSSIIQSKVYCNNVVNALLKIDLKNFFVQRINREKYFNLCELKYIFKNYPEIYNQAVKCRKNYIKKHNKKLMEVR